MSVEANPRMEFSGTWYCTEPKDHPNGEHRAYASHEDQEPVL